MSNLDNKGVVVYCGSSSEVKEVYLETAREMGRLVAEAGISLVSGGGRGGLMAAAIEGASQAGGRTVGVLPGFMIERKWNHPALSECIVTDSMHSRKMAMASMSRAAVALAGGIGTLDELCEMMTWHQLGLFAGPVIIINTVGYFDPLIEMFNRMVEQGFMRDGGIPAVIVATPDEAMRVILNSRNS